MHLYVRQGISLKWNAYKMGNAPNLFITGDHCCFEADTLTPVLANSIPRRPELSADTRVDYITGGL
jgi:hypothetical protein